MSNSNEKDDCQEDDAEEVDATKNRMIDVSQKLIEQLTESYNTV